ASDRATIHPVRRTVDSILQLSLDEERVMSYSYEYAVPAAEALPAERAAFIRRTYGHLAGAILAFIGIEAVLLRLPGIENVARGMAGAWWLILLVFMGVAWLAASSAPSATSPI